MVAQTFRLPLLIRRLCQIRGGGSSGAGAEPPKSGPPYTKERRADCEGAGSVTVGCPSRGKSMTAKLAGSTSFEQRMPRSEALEAVQQQSPSIRPHPQWQI